MAKIVKDRIKRELPVDLIDDEKIARGQELAEAESLLQETEREKKEAMVDFRDKLKDAKYDIMRLTPIVESGKEPREVECEVILSADGKKIQVIRCDTGEVVETRRSTPEDRQVTLSDVPIGD